MITPKLGRTSRSLLTARRPPETLFREAASEARSAAATLLSTIFAEVTLLSAKPLLVIPLSPAPEPMKLPANRFAPLVAVITPVWVFAAVKV